MVDLEENSVEQGITLVNEINWLKSIIYSRISYSKKSKESIDPIEVIMSP